MAKPNLHGKKPAPEQKKSASAPAQKHTRAMPTPEDLKVEPAPPAAPEITEKDILEAREKEEIRKRASKGLLDDLPIDEEDILRAGEAKDKATRLQKATPEPKAVSAFDKVKKKRVEVKDADERKIPKQVVSSFVNSFAKDLGCKVATDVLGSDVEYWYPFDCAPLDIVFGGGIPSGKIVELFGWESSGKSTLTLEAAKAFIRYWNSIGQDNYVVLWIESESALDKVRAQYMGCDLSRFALEEAETVEAGFDIISKALVKAKNEGIHLFISWDTIAAVLTANEKSEEYSGGMGEKARVIRRRLKDISTLLGHTSSTLVFVNQMYKNFDKFGEKDQVPGGGGIKFHASIRAQMTKHSAPIELVLADGSKLAKAIDVDVFTKKNKLTLPYRTCKLIINNESGLDIIETLSRFLVLHKHIDVRGGWKYIDFDTHEYKFQNIEQLKEILEVKSPELRTYMDYLCYLHYSKVSPLMKVKLLDSIWKYELKIYGSKKTKISDKEYSLASLLGRSLLEQQDRDSYEEL
jgi:recombination protein RecA